MSRYYPDTVEGWAWGDHVRAKVDAEQRERMRRRDAGAAELRRRLTRRDPLLFALFYLARHLSDADGGISFADAHLDWCEQARRWLEPTAVPAEDRSVQVAPRDTGKSTWWFLVLPMWAAAHGHVRFAAAFADSADQAQKHLATFKAELDANPSLRRDFPDLCTPARRPGGVTVDDNKAMLNTKAGFVFAAKGIDSSSLGMKIGARRPDLLILDDVEPGESNYSAYQAEQRLTTLLDVVLPLNLKARVVLVGTVTMPDSIVHQAVRKGQGLEHPAWVDEEGFRVSHHLPVVQGRDGSERSMWPARWPLEWLVAESSKRSYAKNFLNDPIGADGGYWTADDFRVEGRGAATRVVLSVDPAVTTKGTSDWTGVAVVSANPSQRRAWVDYARQVRMAGADLRALALSLIAEFGVTHLIVEDNQGGDLWLGVFHDMPVPVRTYKAVASKEVRAAEALNHYQRGRVFHVKRHPELEAQMTAFPKAPHDDMVDAVSAAVNRLLSPRPVRRSGGTSRSYVG